MNLWHGAIRSGKTFASILAFLAFVFLAPREGEIVIVGKNRDSIFRNFFQPIENAPALAQFKGVVSYRNGAATGYILGRLVHVVGANDARSESKIRGMTVAAAYVDEVTVIPHEFFMQLLGRMSVTGARLFGTTNPDSPAHWLKRDFLDKLKGLPHWRAFHFVMSDNPSLTPDYVEARRREYTGLWRKRFIEGRWVAAEGAIFDMFDSSMHVVPWKSLPPMQRLLGVGVDFGTNNPSTGVLLGQSREKVGNRYRSRLYLLDEWGYDSKESTAGTLSPSQQAGLFKSWLHDTHLPYETALRPEFVIVDPAAPHFQKELNLEGISTSGGLNDVSWGLSMMASLFSEQQLVVSDRCDRLIKELPGYAWDPKKAKEGLDVPVKVADHWIDASRYVVATTENLWRPGLDWQLAA
ncbi:PBSX family phage terminase large subunit [Pseudoclavibacter helvolus]|uniref:PBSX family phage terminase large subunit n=1 Tax=Pseudoclavibacter helvolus TaxID=255205 RepID=UPI0035E68D20